MITAKTESGFAIELEDDALEDQELFDAISGMQDGNVFSMSHLTERLLGTEGLSGGVTGCRRLPAQGFGDLALDALCRGHDLHIRFCQLNAVRHGHPPPFRAARAASNSSGLS